ncbi:zinc-dependent metalloprotease [Nocardioides sp. ChNu-153]|uniref:zinc-dependent metalloprotease n=1 Tax=unclassified Nocardioides TaxID=2615069 RepID=UPI00240597CA|nr:MULTISPECIES: zinc-dependent metalloprotease [unclassified Nocardioides]MDF9716257.1 zinc-dependent metalloprotease [Nocardioides sp. ChNu-99]MDN7122001.1 zinc-dependent metalloprotease [Nocardioides sp. ChNu-153]
MSSAESFGPPDPSATGAPAIDWALAARIGARLAPPEPAIPAESVAETVEALRADAERSSGLVREFTGLHAVEHSAPVLVVDRRRWIEANTQSFGVMMQPFVDQLAQRRSGGPQAPEVLRRAGAAVGSRVTGAELGALLGLLSGKVLGQFDPFAPADVAPDGRLLLVAPNVWQVAEEIGARHRDFRLWVCLHEETHRVQFTAVPWLRDHLRAQVEALAGTLDPSAVLGDGLSRVVEAVRGGGGGSIVDMLSTPDQKEIIDRVTGVMSLLEGHADVVMDGVGPGVIPTVKRIRRAFEQRRDGVGHLDRLLRRLLGLDAKMAQYRDGAAFVRSVVDRVGMDDFNAVWSAPEALPSRSEIADPDAWVARVLA